MRNSEAVSRSRIGFHKHHQSALSFQPRILNISVKGKSPLKVLSGFYFFEKTVDKRGFLCYYYVIQYIVMRHIVTRDKEVRICHITEVR